MENKILQENLQAVEKYDSNLANKILTTDYKKSNFNVAETQNGYYNLFFCNIALHDNLNPKRESEIIAEKIENKENKDTIRIVYGLGLGYLIDEISNVVQNAPIILYEPNIDILKYVFEIAQIDAIFKKNVFVATNKNELVKLVEKYTNENTQITISFLNSYKILFEKDIYNVLNIAQKTVGEFYANKNLKRKDKFALHYTLLNLKKIIKNPDISQLVDIYKGKTALIASGGATLSENIETIKKNKEKVVIFALSQSAKYLIENGINPDFIVNIDVYNNKNHFKDIKTEDFYFILEGFCCSDVFNMPAKKIFNYISEGNFFNYWLRDCLSIEHNLKSTGTVSISAFLSACVMGFKRIVLIGQDLAYKNGQLYTKGSVADNLECVLENNKYVIKPKDWDKFFNSMKKDGETAEKTTRDLKHYLEQLNRNIYTIKGQNGELLPTQMSYAYFVDYFSQLAEILKTERSELELINSSIGGAQIDGFKNIDLESVLKNIPTVEKINLDNIEPCFDKNHASKKISELYDEFSYTERQIIHLKQIYSNIFSILESENKINENILKLIDEQKLILNGLINHNNELINCALKGRIETYINLNSDNFKNDFENLKKNVKILLDEKKLESTIKSYKDILADCKSLVLE